MKTEVEKTSQVKSRKFGIWRLISAYILAVVLVCVAIIGIGKGIDEILMALNKDHDISFIFMLIASGIVILGLAKLLVDMWRSSDRTDINLGVIAIKNPFYDPDFVKGSIVLQRLYAELSTMYNEQKELLEEAEVFNTKQSENIAALMGKIRVSLRHTDNSNRLLRSLNYLYYKRDKNLIQKMLADVLQECVTILEKDQSDKSISLFQVQGSNLRIIESVRINAESVDKRTFTKGEGFAGAIWESQQPTIVNSIEEEDSRFNDYRLQATPIGSIVGYPLIAEVGGEVLGVLCLQSEVEDGFNEEADLRTVEFYARLCTTVLLHDKIERERTGEGIQ